MKMNNIKDNCSPVDRSSTAALMSSISSLCFIQDVCRIVDIFSRDGSFDHHHKDEEQQVDEALYDSMISPKRTPAEQTLRAAVDSVMVATICRREVEEEKDSGCSEERELDLRSLHKGAKRFATVASALAAFTDDEEKK